MKKVKKLIIPLMLMVSLLVLSLTGCGRSAKDKYYEDGSKLGYMLGTGIQDNVGLFGPKMKQKTNLSKVQMLLLVKLKDTRWKPKKVKQRKKAL